MLLVNPSSLDQFTEHVVNASAGTSPTLLRTLKLLGDEDRLLIDMALKHRLSLRQMSVVLKLSPGSVSRRLRRLLNRLHDPIVTALSDPHCLLTPEQRDIGIEYFLQDLSIPVIARQHRMSRNEISKTLEFIRGWHRGFTARR